MKDLKLNNKDLKVSTEHLGARIPSPLKRRLEKIMVNKIKSSGNAKLKLTHIIVEALEKGCEIIEPRKKSA